MSGKRGFWMVLLAAAIAAAVFGAMPSDAVAGRDAPAVTLEGPDCIWFMMGWWSGNAGGAGGSGSSGSDDNQDDGEDQFDEHFPWESYPFK